MKATALLPLLLVLAPLAGAQNRLYTFDGDGPADVFGWSVSGAGDVNGDGVPDMIVGAYEPFPPLTGPGYARVFSGADGSIIHDLTGDEAGGWFGVSVSGYADFDGDGFDDLLIGSPARDTVGVDSGSAFLISGDDGCVLLRLDGDDAGDLFGRAVADAGDVNGDGVPDFVVGAPNDDDNGENAGSVSVYSGIGGVLLYRFDGDAAGDTFGFSVSGAGDVNCDGYADIVVGAYQKHSGSGYARVFSGMDGTTLFTKTGTEFEDEFAYSVSDAGDVNNDGYDDIIIGARSADPEDTGFGAGTASVFLGPDGALLYVFSGHSDDMLGTSVTGLGDIDGDGYDEFAYGRRHDNLFIHTGSVDVHSGRTGGLLFEIHGDAEDNFFGSAVSDVGDVNLDGVPDLLVGAFREDSNGNAAGRAALFSGTCLAPMAYCASAPNSSGACAVMGFSGSYVHADNDLSLTAGGAVSGQFGVFFYARRVGETPFGDGFLCMNPEPVGTFRLNPPVLIDAAGAAMRDLDLMLPPACDGDGFIGSGTEWHFQFWYRDPFGPSGTGFNLSNALSITFCP